MDAIHFEQIAKELAFWKEKHEETRSLAQATAGRVVLAITQKISLRELARRTKRSSTYLSHISSEKTRCADALYIELVEVLKSLEAEELPPAKKSRRGNSVRLQACAKRAQ